MTSAGEAPRMRGGGGLFPAMNRDDIGRFSQRLSAPAEVSLPEPVPYSEHDEDCPAFTSPYADCECGAEDNEDDGRDPYTLEEYERERDERDNDW